MYLPSTSAVWSRLGSVRRQLASALSRKSKQRLARAVAATIEPLEQRTLLSVTISYEVDLAGTTTPTSEITEGTAIQLNNVAATSNSGGTIDPTYTVDWGDGSLEETHNWGEAPTHAYSEPSGRSPRPIAVWTNETNADGSTDQGCLISMETVDEATPTLSLTGNASVAEGSTYTVSPSLSDAGGDSVSQWQISWGDGHSETDSPQGSYSHVFNTTGNLTITATATTEDGQYSTTLPVQVTGQPPSTPTNFSAVAAGTQVNTSWTASSGTVTSYHVQRSTDGTNYADIATNVQGTSYVDTTPPDGTCWYRVYAANGVAYSGYSNAQSVMVAPAAPTGLAVSPTAKSLSITWNASSGATSYQLLRKGPTDSSYVQIANQSGTSFTDSDVLPSTTYSYEVTASSATGTSSACSPVSGTTASLAPNFTPTSDSVSITWSSWPAVTSYQVLRSPNDRSFAQVASQSGTSFIDPNVLPNTTYYYELTATGSGGASSTIGPFVATTPNVAPAAPSNLTAPGVSTSQINLNWTDNSNNESGFAVDRSTDDVNWTNIANTAANVTNYSDTGLTDGTAYYYRVRAVNSVGSSANATTSAYTQLLAPTALTSSFISGGDINLSWTNNSTHALEYSIEQSPNGTTWTPVGSTTDGTSHTFAAPGPFGPSTAYYFRVRGFGSGGYSGYTNTATITTPAFPNAPSNLTATAGSSSEINLSWTDNSNNETGFVIDRSVDGSNWATITTAPANATSYTDGGLTEGTLYYYRVHASNSFGSSANTSTVSAYTQLIAPTSLTASFVSSNTVNLAWVDNSTRATSYLIEQSVNFTNWTQIGSLSSSTAASFTATGPFDPSATYYFRVRAAGPGPVYSAYSNVATAATPAYPSAPTNLSQVGGDYGSISLTWTASIDNVSVSSYNVYRDGTLIGTATGTSFTDSPVTAGTGASYTVGAVDASGKVSVRSAALYASTLAPPTPVLEVVSSTEIQLNWADGADATGYQVQRSADGGTTWTQAASLPAGTTSFLDQSLQPSTTYQYQISATLTAGGTVTGDVVSTTTSDATPTNLTASNISGDSIGLSWTYSGSATSFSVEQSSDGGSTWLAAGATTGGATTLSVPGPFAASTSYQFRVQTAGDSPSDYSAPLTVTTPAWPSVPQNLQAVPQSGGSISVTWTDAGDAQNFNLSRSTDGGATWQSLATLPGTAVSYSDTSDTVAFAETDYRLSASNAAGASASVSTDVGDLVISGVSGSLVSLNWTGSLFSSAANQIDVQESADGATAWNTISTNPPGSTGAIVSVALAASTRYYFRLNAVGSGYSAYSNVVSLTTPAFPVAPTAVSAVAVSPAEVDVSWTDSGSDAASFLVLRSDDGGSSWGEVASVSATTRSYPDTSVLDDSSYIYEVAAIGSSKFTSAFGVSAPVAVPLQLPTNLYVQSASITGISFGWELNSAYATQVVIQQSSDDSPGWQTIDTVPATQTFYTISKQLKPQNYSFRLQAVDGVGVTSAYSQTLDADVPEQNPVAHDDSFPVNGAGAYNSPTSILINDVDPEKLPLTIVSNTEPAHGTLSLSADGTFTYTPNSGYSGEDTFTYIITDGIGESDPATVSLEVSSADHAPIAYSSSAYLSGNPTIIASGAVTASDADHDRLTYSVLQQPSVGTLNFNADGTFTYTAPTSPQYVTFTFRANDGTLNSNIASVAIGYPNEGDPTDTNDPVQEAEGEQPTALNGTYAAVAGATLQVDAAHSALAQGSGYKNPLTLGSIIEEPQHGTLTVNSDLSFTYVPNSGFTGQDYFTYTLKYSTISGMPVSNYATVQLGVALTPPIAYRAGNNYGDQVSRTDLMSGNPSNYVILVDDGYSADPTGESDNLDYNQSQSDSGDAVDVNNRNFARVSFQPIQGISQGTIQIQLSNSSSVRLYDSSGNLLQASQLNLNLASPSGPLAALAGSSGKPVDIYIEGASADPDFKVTETYTDQAGNQAKQSFDMAVVKISYLDQNGQTLDGVSALPEDQLLAEISGNPEDPIAQGMAQQFSQNSGSVEFKTLLDGISAADVQALMENGQTLGLTNGTQGTSAEAQNLELVDDGTGMSTSQQQQLGSQTGTAVVPVNATVEISTKKDDLVAVLPANQTAKVADFFFDGTGNDGPADSATLTDTNVWKMYKADPNALKYYEYGVGTRTYGYAGLITGLGADQILAQAEDQFVKAVNHGATTIDIVGFSRGSAEALEFSNWVADRLVNQTIPKLDAYGHQVYTPTGIFSNTPVYLNTGEVWIRFVGLYDTVSSFRGSPGYQGDKRVSIPTSVPIGLVVHAVALSEHRYRFPWTDLSKPGVNLVQVGFRGAHSDIGGGYGPNDGISNITLHWMMYEAGTVGWTFSTLYPSLKENYSLLQVNDSYLGEWTSGSSARAINRALPSNLLCWTPGLTPAGTLVPFGSEPISYWDPFWNYSTRYPSGWIYGAFQ